MEELKQLLEKVTELTDITTRILKNSTPEVNENLLFKGVEDGILDKIHTATPYQRANLSKSYKFRYYRELNDPEALQAEIQRRLRDHQLKIILSE